MKPWFFVTVLTAIMVLGTTCLIAYIEFRDPPKLRLLPSVEAVTA